jgi:nitrogen fixation/metabolism regulation signal transduction histidine kinase
MKTLVDGFNAMVRSLKAHQQEMAEMGKKVAWAEMARKVAHEIKNPLTPIQLSAEHILKVYEDRGEDFDKALKESISYIIGEVENLRRISQEFMEIARDTTLCKEPCDLKEVLEGMLAPYKKLLASRIRFRETYEGADFNCLADAAKIGTAFCNIVTNAIEAVKETGEIVVLVRRGDQGLMVSIRDSGPGMSREVLDKIFEPYFSTKTAGTGLGLPIAKKIIEDHGGSVRVASGPGRGTTVTVDLP